MDIKLEKENKRFAFKHFAIAATVVVVAIVFYLLSKTSGVSYLIEKQQIRTAKVERGPFNVNVRSIGKVNAKDLIWIGAEVSGRIEQIHIENGDSVEIGTPLVTLRNPQLINDHKKAVFAYQQAKAEYTATLKSLESQLLALQGETLKTKLAFQGNQLKMEAEKTLLASGNGIVSAITHQQTIFSVEEQKQLWALYKRRVASMQENIDAQKEVNVLKLKGLQNDVEDALRNSELLVVRSLSSGLVQEIKLEPGQQLKIGDTVARVADTDKLIVELKVQELQVGQVEVGQKVEIDTRKSKVPGVVTRVHPAVDQGMVQVDVEFADQVPSEVRISLSVEGTISIYSINDALYVRKPAFVKPGAQLNVYKLEPDSSIAQRRPVSFGVSSVNYVLIDKGLTVGDEIIISDHSDYISHDSILIQ